MSGELDRRRERPVLAPQVLAAAVVLFVILVAHALLETARDALFLARLGPHLLAAAYLVMAAAALLAVVAVRRWGRLRDPRRMLLAFLGLALAGTTTLALTVLAAPALVFVLYVWTGFVATLVVPTFWTAIDRSLHITEAKRVFGAIGAGGVLGAMVGSAIASLLGRLVAPHYLVTAGAIAFALALAAAAVLVPHTTVEELPARRTRAESLTHRSRRYVRAMLIIGLISTIALTLGDLTFKRVLAERLRASDLATVFGAIYTALNVVGLAIQVLVTPRLLARWGVGGTMTVLPLIILASSLGFVATGAMIAVIALKLGDGGLRHSLHRTSSEILYLPLPSAVRDGWKVVADALGQRGGQAIAALLVFGAGWLGATAQEIAALTALATVVWLAAVARVRRAYVAQFRDTLQAGEIQRDVALPALDADSIARLTESLASPDEIEALAALDLLARYAGIPALVFYHPQPAVVRRALSLIEGELRPDAARVLEHLFEHADPKIRAAALAASVRAGGHHARLTRALDDPALEVRAVALVGLASGDRHELDPRLTALAASPAAEQLALAEAIGFMPHERFQGVLDDLVARGDPDVIARVLHVWARAPELADPARLLALLADRRVRAEARRVFLALGRRGLDILIAALDDPATPLAIRRHVPRTLSRFHSRDAAAALVRRLPHEPHSGTELKLLRALGRMRTDDPHLTIDPAPVREYLRRAVRDAARYATFLDYLEEGRAHASASAKLIEEILVEKRRIAIEHAFRALGILHPRAGVRSAHDAIASGDEARRSAAQEIVSAIVPPDVRGTLLAVIDDLTPAERRAALGELAPGPFRGYPTFLAALLADPSESLRCVVAQHVAERHFVGLSDELARLRPADGPALVAQAFDHALAVLHG